MISGAKINGSTQKPTTSQRRTPAAANGTPAQRAKSKAPTRTPARVPARAQPIQRGRIAPSKSVSRSTATTFANAKATTFNQVALLAKLEQDSEPSDAEPTAESAP